MRRIQIMIMSLLVIFANSCALLEDKEPTLVNYVYPRMGTLTYGDLCFGGVCPAVSVPWGMNAWTPQTEPYGDHLIYNYGTDHINGFRQTHTSSVGEREFGAFSIMPVSSLSPVDECGRASLYSHKYEKSLPYRYDVFLASHNIDVSFSALDYSAIFEITYNQSGRTNDIVVDLFPGGSYIEIVNDTTILASTAQNTNPSVVPEFRNYIVFRTDTPIMSYEVTDMTTGRLTDSLSGHHLVLRMKFDAKDKQITLRTASSFVGFSRARKNIEEIKGMNLDEVARRSALKWEEVLQRFTLENVSDYDRKLFYSILYRALQSPRKIYEVLGQETDGRPAGTLYFSLADGRLYEGYMYNFDNLYIRTFSQIPMLNVFYPDVAMTMYSALNDYVLQDKGMDTLFRDAVLRIVSDADSDGMLDNFPNLSALVGESHTKDILRTPGNLYVYKDTSYTSVIWNSAWDNYIEGRYATADGRKELESCLDNLFNISAVRDSTLSWIRSLQTVSRMGRYFHSYSPMQSAPYLYHYTESPYKSQYWCREILERSYKFSPDGFSGPDISGTLSSWFIFSALGFYPVDPVSNIYIAGSPLYKHVFVTYDSGRQLWLSSTSDINNKYIRNLALQGKLVRNEIPLEQLRQGGSIYFNMMSRPEPQSLSLYKSEGELLNP